VVAVPWGGKGKTLLGEGRPKKGPLISTAIPLEKGFVSAFVAQTREEDKKKKRGEKPLKPAVHSFWKGRCVYALCFYRPCQGLKRGRRIMSPGF